MSYSLTLRRITVTPPLASFIGESGLFAVGPRATVFLGACTGDGQDAVGAAAVNVLRRRVSTAVERRRRLCGLPVPRTDTAYRLINDVADGVPYCTVDLYDKAAVVQWSNSSMEQLLHQPLLAVLREIEVVPVSPGLSAADPVVFFEQGVELTSSSGYDVCGRAARRVLVAAACRKDLMRGGGEELPQSSHKPEALVVNATAAALSGNDAASVILSRKGFAVTQLVPQRRGRERENDPKAFVAPCSDEVLNVPYADDADPTKALSAALGPSRRFHVGLVKIDANIALPTVDSIVASVAARIVPQGYIALWIVVSPGGNDGRRVLPSQLLSVLRSRVARSLLNNASSGTPRRIRAVQELHPGSDFTLQLRTPHDVAPLQADDASETCTVTFESCFHRLSSQMPAGFLWQLD